MSIAEFEVMRAANDRRNTVWAAALASHVRDPYQDTRGQVRDAILMAIDRGDLILARTNWSGDQPRAIQLEVAKAALEEESQWHPRRLPWARRLRLMATKQGADRYWAGEFGVPAPITVYLPSASDALEVQSVTCAEATGMAIGVVGFVAGSTLGYLLATGGFPFLESVWSLSAVLAWIAGGIVGLTAALWTWNSRFPSAEDDGIPPSLVPDQFNQGPDLNGQDVFGDSRF